MTLSKISLTVAAALIAGAALAQENLTKEITLDKDYVPVERKATKANELPTAVERSAEQTSLNYSQLSVPTPINPRVPTMLPYGYKTSKDWSSQRGYVDFGIGTQLNIVGSAGFNILNTEKNRLALWFQHNSTWMGKNVPQEVIKYSPSQGYTKEEIGYKQKFNDNTIAASYQHNFYAGTLKAQARGHFDSYNYYYFTEDMTNLMEVGAKADWTSRTAPDQFNYRAGVDYNFLKFTKNDMRENNFKAYFSGEYQSGEYAHPGMNVRPETVGQKAAEFVWSGEHYLGQTRTNYGMLTLNPYFLYSKAKLRALLGANIDISWSDGAVFRFAPNVGVDYAVAQGFGVYLKAEGGKRIHTVSEMHSICRYWNSLETFGSTYSPFDGELGVNIGSFGGFSAKVFGGYGYFKNAFVPNTSIPYFLTVDARDQGGWKVGAALDYKYRHLVSASLDFTYAPQDAEKGYILDYERSKMLLNARIEANPIEKLNVSLSYEMRSRFGLDNVHNLGVGARYTVLPNLDVWASGNNLLNRRWQAATTTMRSQGINAMLGAEFRF
mgnify:FL=1